MLMTLQSEVDKFIGTMDFCLNYSPELLTETQYLSEVNESVKKLKVYIKDLEENRYGTHV